MLTRDIAFESQGTGIAGTFLFPAIGRRPCPAVLLLHGASEGERTHYRVFAQRFAEAGIASLFFDRRGHGDSGGTRDMNLFLLAKDAEAAFTCLAAQREVDAARAGLWGYSNGAWVASLAARAVQPAFLVLAGAAGVTPGRAEAFRRAHDLERQGIARETGDAVERAWTLIFGCLATGAPDAAASDELTSLAAIIQADRALERILVPDFVRERPELDAVPRFDRPPLNESLAALAGTSPDMGFDPIPVLKELTCPTLVVLAENDANTAPQESRARFEEVVATRPGVRVEQIAGATHEFSAGGQPWPGGQARAPEDYVPGYLDLMSDWLATVTAAVT